MREYDIFISFRVSEAEREARALKRALERWDLRVFLCDVRTGNDAGRAIIQALSECRMVVVLGTRTYGKQTKASYSTYQELRYIMEERKPFFLIKMCNAFTEHAARFHLTGTTQHHPWGQFQDGHRIYPSNDLVDAIVNELNAQATPPTEDEDEFTVGGTESVHAKNSVHELDHNDGMATTPLLGATPQIHHDGYDSVQAFEIDTTTDPAAVKLHQGCSQKKRAIYLLLAATILVAVGAGVAVSVSGGKHSGSCGPTTTATLDCSDPSSQKQFRESRFCEAGAVINCCCDEFYKLQRVLGSVSLYKGLGSLRFPSVISIDGDIRGAGGALTSVDFDRLRSVGGKIDLSGNTITSVSFGDLTSVARDVELGSNGIPSLNSISFGKLTALGGSVKLAQNGMNYLGFEHLMALPVSVNVTGNSITSVDFGQLRDVAGSLSLLETTLTLSAGVVTGDVAFGNTGLSWISFGVITSIRGSLFLAGNYLTQLDLGPLTSIGKDLDVSGNSHLKDLTFKGVTNVNGSVFVSNTRLTYLNFDTLSNVGGGLYVSENYALENTNLGQLAFVGDSLSVSAVSVTSIDFGSLSHVGGRLSIMDNHKLTSIDLQRIAYVGGSLAFRGMSLTNLNLGDLTRVDGDITLTFMFLESMDFGQLIHLGGGILCHDIDTEVFIARNLAFVGGDVRLGGLELMKVDLGSLVQVGGSLVLSDNGLESVMLANLAYVNGSLWLGGNPNLISTSFGRLTFLGGDLSLPDAKLASVSFGNLGIVGRGLVLANNLLTTINLGELSRVGDLFLARNSLSAISFGRLTTIAGDLDLSSNELTTVDFGALNAVNGTLDLTSNSLKTIDCQGLSAKCMRIDSAVNYTNCPAPCS